MALNQTERLDLWEQDLVHKYNIPAPTNDFDAYNKYPKQRWVYDKYKMSRYFNADLYVSYCEIPHDKKCVVRPRFNLQGLGRNAKVGNSRDKVPFGFFAQEFIKGRHLSIDFLNGQIVAYVGRKLKNSFDFYLWRRVPVSTDLLHQVHDIAKILDVPIFNIEMIGIHIIEIHLRPSIQFWSQPMFSLVMHKDYQCRVLDWKPKEIHDVMTNDKPEDTRKLIINSDNLRVAYQYACLCFS